MSCRKRKNGNVEARPFRSWGPPPAIILAGEQRARRNWWREPRSGQFVGTLRSFIAVAQSELGIAEAGLRCFNNPSGNDLSYRILAVIQFEDAKGAFIGRREPLNVIRPEHRFCNSR